MEAELVEEMALEEPRRLVRDLPAAEVGMDRQPAEVGDAVPPAAAREAHRAGPLAVDLDHEHAEHVRLGHVALDVVRQRFAVVRPAGGEERLHFLVRDELDEEVEIVRPRATDRDHYAGSSLGAARRRTSTGAPIRARRQGG